MSPPLDRMAVISDIHGNLPALEAVLADIEARGISRIYGLGDLAGKGPDGAAAIDISRRVCVATVQGNWDESLANAEPDSTVMWHRRQLGPERLAWLRDLPPTVDFRLSGRKVRLFHASARGTITGCASTIAATITSKCSTTPTSPAMGLRPISSAMATSTPPM